MTRRGLRHSLGVGLMMVVALGAMSGLSWGATQQELNDFLTKIQDAKGEVRRAAWESAGEMGAEAVAPLGKLLGGENRAAAKAAGRALEVVAHYASRPGAEAERKAVSAALIELTKTGNPAKVRDKALRLLGSTGQNNAVPAIAALLGDKEVLEAARWALERIPGKASNVALIGALNKLPSWEKSDVQKFREAIISTLGAKGAPEAAVPLVKFLQSDEQRIRIAAVEALGRIGDPRTASEILNVARRRSGREKAIALDNYLRVADRLAEKGRTEGALRMYGDVLKGFKDDVPRCGALVGIGKVGGDAALRILWRALSEPSPVIRSTAVTSLTTMKGENVGRAIVRMISRAEPELKPLLLQVLVNRKEPLAVRVLAKASEHPDAEVRLAALELIGKLGDQALAPQLLRAVEKEGPEGKQAALRSYLQIAGEVLRQGEASVALAMFHKTLTLATEDAEKRVALRGIAAIGSVRSLETVKQLMKKPALQDEAARAYIAIASRVAVSGRKERAVKMLTEVVEWPYSVGVIQLAAARLKELGVIIPIARRSGFVTHWWLVGAFPNPSNSAWEKEFPPEKEVDLGKGVELEGKTLRWKEVTTGHPQARINLEDHFKPTENVAAYAYTEIKVPKETNVKFKIGSDDSVVCWLNGERIHAIKVSRGLSVDKDVVNTTLQAGRNTILMKVLNESAQWEFCLRITDRRDKPIDLSKLTK